METIEEYNNRVAEARLLVELCGGHLPELVEVLARRWRTSPYNASQILMEFPLGRKFIEDHTQLREEAKTEQSAYNNLYKELFFAVRYAGKLISTDNDDIYVCPNITDSGAICNTPFVIKDSTKPTFCPYCKQPHKK